MIPECHGELIIRAFGCCSFHQAYCTIVSQSNISSQIHIAYPVHIILLNYFFGLFTNASQTSVGPTLSKQTHYMSTKILNFGRVCQYPVCLWCDWEFIISYARQLLDKYFYFSWTRTCISMSPKRIILWALAFCHYICNIYIFLVCSGVQALLAGFIGTYCSGMSTGWCRWGLTEQRCCRDSGCNQGLQITSCAQVGKEPILKIGCCSQKNMVWGGISSSMTQESLYRK